METSSILEMIPPEGHYLQFQIDQALEIRDEELFLYHTKKLKESSDLKVKLESYLNKGTDINIL